MAAAVGWKEGDPPVSPSSKTRICIIASRLEVPSWISLFDNLKVLDITVNGCDHTWNNTIPVHIFGILTLRVLRLRDFDGFYHLPSAIGNLVNLQELQLLCNDLVAFPPEIGCLQRLKILALVYGNNMQELPAELGRLKVLSTPDFMLIDRTKSNSPYYGWSKVRLRAHLRERDPTYKACILTLILCAQRLRRRSLPSELWHLLNLLYLS